jgi:hypothetical protein
MGGCLWQWGLAVRWDHFRSYSIFFVFWIPGVELHAGTSGILLGCEQWMEMPRDVRYCERVDTRTYKNVESSC